MSEINCPSCGHPVRIPDRKSGLWWGLGCLAAVIASFVIIAIVGLLAAIAIPSFVRAKEMAQYNACVNNLRVIEAGKEQAALERNFPVGYLLSDEELSAYLQGGLGAYLCPVGGDYTVNPMGQQPACSFHGERYDAGD